MTRPEFIEYVASFYLPTHEDVLYPIEGLTRQKIEDALDVYLERIEKGDLEYVHYSWGGGDSVDRERVRDIINEYSISALEATAPDYGVGK